MFSQRTSWSLQPNRLHQLAAARRAQTGEAGLIDLTISNPTACGFDYPAAILKALAAPAALRYTPDPFGLLSAREAVAQYYHERGLAVPPTRLALTASTSEAYSHLFRLLCNAGEAALMPAPSYPLFEMLAGLHDVRLRAVPMRYANGWSLDIEALAAAGDDVRALLLVHPNNPAGNYITPQEWAVVQTLAAARGWAVVVDEVFFDFALLPNRPVALDFDHCPALTFLLNGCSKLSAIPQMKLAWIAAFGPAAFVEMAWARLEVVLDAYLSVATPIECAAPALLAARHQMQPQIRARLAANLATLDAALAPLPALERLQTEGGWSVMLRLPHIHSGGRWAELLVEHAGVLTHPGHFYGLDHAAYLVFSLLPEPAVFAAGLRRLTTLITAELP